MFPLLVIGSLNMDLIVRAARLPQPGETVIGARFSTAAGGKGANQAVAAARLGAGVRMIGRIGDDEFGHRVRAEVAAAGVEVSHVRVDTETATATGHIVVDGEGRNAIVVASGANARLTPDDLASAENAWIDARLMVLHLEIPLATHLAAIAIARERSIRVILNAAPMDVEARALIEAADCLVVNEVEAEQLAGEPITSAADALDFAHALQQRGQAIVVTIGAGGAVLATGGRTSQVAAPRVEVVDTTAAGDAFVGGFSAALLRGLPETEALRHGVMAGSLACTRLGAIPSLPVRSELEERLA